MLLMGRVMVIILVMVLAPEDYVRKVSGQQVVVKDCGGDVYSE